MILSFGVIGFIYLTHYKISHTLINKLKSIIRIPPLGHPLSSHFSISRNSLDGRTQRLVSETVAQTWWH